MPETRIIATKLLWMCLCCGEVATREADSLELGQVLDGPLMPVSEEIQAEWLVLERWHIAELVRQGLVERRPKHGL